MTAEISFKIELGQVEAMPVWRIIKVVKPVLGPTIMEFIGHFYRDEDAVLLMAHLHRLKSDAIEIDRDLKRSWTLDDNKDS
jgi:hypothetical protein